MAAGLLIVDVQQGLVDALEASRRTEFLATVADVATRARGAGVPVVYVRHGDEELVPGTPAWDVAREIAPRPGEPVVEKSRPDSFDGTNLAEVLASLAVDHVVVCGMQSEHCIDGTVRGALARGYRTTVVEDAHATYPFAGRSEADIRGAVNSGLRSTAAEFVSAGRAFSAP